MTRSGWFSTDLLHNTVFSRKWVLAVMDEAHVSRKLNQSYRAYLALRLHSWYIVAMTATPINGGPSVSLFFVTI